jgi:hypothetical protein
MLKVTNMVTVWNFKIILENLTKLEFALAGIMNRNERLNLIISIYNSCYRHHIGYIKSRPPLGLTQSPIQWVPGALFLGVKRPGCEANHSPPCSSEVKNSWRSTSTPPLRLHDMVLS